MDVDSDSDISIPDDADDLGSRKGKGKAKAGDKRKRDKGKGKAKDAVNFTSPSHVKYMLTQNLVKLTGIHLGSFIHTILGHRARGRGR